MMRWAGNLKRKHGLIVAVWMVISGCGNTQDSNREEKIQNSVPQEITEFEFNEEIHNFGTLTAGEVVIFSFVATNTGQNPLVISTIESDCGCIQTRFNGQPVLPGEKGIIEVEWNTSGLIGRQYQPLMIEMNTKDTNFNIAVVADVQNKDVEFTY